MSSIESASQLDLAYIAADAYYAAQDALDELYLEKPTPATVVAIHQAIVERERTSAIVAAASLNAEDRARFDVNDYVGI